MDKSGSSSVRVEKHILVWIIHMLQSRIVNLVIGEASIKMKTTRGIPQSGIISYLLRLIVINTIL